MPQKCRTTHPSGPQTTGLGCPKNWPRGITYLHSPAYSEKLNPETIKLLVFPKSDLAPGEQAYKTSGPYSHLKITPIANAAHPANGQYGLFTGHHLSPDSFILSYLGYVHDQSDNDETSDYDLSLDREHGVGADASKMGNEARFINDYRGVASSPNAEFRDIFVNLGNGKVEERIGVFVLSAGKSGKRIKGVPKGGEILVSYGKGFWSERVAALE